MENQDIYNAILSGDAATVSAGVKEQLEKGAKPGDLLNQTMIPAMRKVGALFEEGEYYVPEMLISARAMKAGMDVIKPLLAGTGVEPVGKIALGTVQGDIHDIGKNLVGMMMEGAGFEVLDLGVNVPPEKFVEAARSGAQVIGMSALLTTTMPNITGVIQALKDAGLRDKVKVVVGGAPLTETYAVKIGADGYAPDASQAVKKVESLLGL